VSLAALVALFGAGVASFLAPCVLPLVPAYLAMMTGGANEDVGTGAPVGAAVVFVAGFSLVFAVLGGAAGWLGARFDGVQLWTQRVGGLLVVGFGVALLVDLGRRQWRLVERLPVRGAIVRPLVMGIGFGAAWTPCVGPLLGSALVVAARSGGVGRGVVLLFAYGLGVGVPFVVAALVVVAVPALVARLQVWSRALQRVAGVALVLVGGLLALGRYGWLTSLLARAGRA
jgi:cytochrome c-type biogenesis protein